MAVRKQAEGIDMPENESLGNMLEQSVETETVETPSPAQAEQQTVEAADSSLKTDETAVEEQTKTEVAEPTKAELDFKELRGQKDTLKTELSQFREKLNGLGGESHLQIMTPVLQVAQETPSPDEMGAWSERAWGALSQSFLPDQVKALKDEAAWSYLLDPASSKVIAEDLYGVTPEIIKELTDAYRTDPEGVMAALRPEETETERRARAAEQAANDLKKSIEEQAVKRETEELTRQGQQVMSQVLQTGLAPRDEIKKQFGLEFDQNGKDTPEIASFKQRVSARYDRLVRDALGSDQELNRLSNTAEFYSKQRDVAQRQKAIDQFSPLIEQRARVICTEIAKDLAADLTLLNPQLADQTKVNNLKDLKPNLLGSTGTQSGAAGFDLTGMPDPATNPRGYEAWVARKTAEIANAQRTPAIVQAG